MPVYVLSSGKSTEISVPLSTLPLAVGRCDADMSIDIELPAKVTNAAGIPPLSHSPLGSNTVWMAVAVEIEHSVV